jgi:hypothetical protein
MLDMLIVGTVATLGARHARRQAGRIGSEPVNSGI